MVGSQNWLLQCCDFDKLEVKPYFLNLSNSDWATVVYTMGPRPLFSKCNLPQTKVMTGRRSVEVISGNLS